MRFIRTLPLLLAAVVSATACSETSSPTLAPEADVEAAPAPSELELATGMSEGALAALPRWTPPSRDAGPAMAPSGSIVLDFEDLESGSHRMLDHSPYHGVTFSKPGDCWRVGCIVHWDAVSYGRPVSGTKFLVSWYGRDGEYMDFTGYPGGVTFEGAWLANPHGESPSFWWEGYKDGALVGSTTPVVLTGTPQWIGAAFAGPVDRVVFRRTAGAACNNRSTCWWVADDVTFTAGPTDATPPTITPSVSGTLGNDGWYTSDVTVSWSVVDPDGDVTIDSGCVDSTVDTDTAGETFTCAASSAGGSADASVTVKRDATPPSIGAALAGTVGDNGWYTSDVAVAWTVSDAMSGVASTTCSDNTVSSDGAHEQECDAEDAAGNTASGSTGSFKRDATPPVVTYAGNAGTYDVAETVAISCSTADATSGIASDDCAEVTGAAWGFGLGVSGFSATATDNAGNTGSGSTTFEVTASYSGLCSLVETFVSHTGVANALCQKVAAAERANARGQTNARDGSLGAFINQVEAQRGKKIDAAHADVLAQVASALMN